jgi:rubrerythrin
MKHTTTTRVTRHTCLRCDYTWMPRYPTPPKVCPVCKSLLWRTRKGVKP